MLEKRTIGMDASLPELQRYIYSNHLQSASLELDEFADIISYEEYHPYGTTAYQATNSAINAVSKRYRYTGKERDEESGLYYHGARYYIPWLARWTACDPLESKYAGMSPYNYSFNNPVIFNDPSGNSPTDPGDGDNKKPKAKVESIADPDRPKMPPVNIPGKVDNARDVRSNPKILSKYDITGDVHDFNLKKPVSPGEIKKEIRHENTWYYVKLASKVASQGTGNVDPAAVADGLINPFYKQFQQFATDFTDNPIVRNLDGTQAWNKLDQSQAEFDKKMFNFIEVSSWK
jgi:RHS repeat-associated protein